MKNIAFTRLLHSRGMNVTRLAALILSERSHVNRVLLGYPGRGAETREKLIHVLTAEELAALGWNNQFHVEQKVPGDTNDTDTTRVAGHSANSPTTE